MDESDTELGKVRNVMENYMAKKKNGRMKWKVSLCVKRFVEFWELSLWNF